MLPQLVEIWNESMLSRCRDIPKGRVESEKFLVLGSCVESASLAKLRFRKLFGLLSSKCWDAATSMVANAMKARERREDGREMSRNGGGDVGLARMSA
jgi:hypothetical protein